MLSPHDANQRPRILLPLTLGAVCLSLFCSETTKLDPCNPELGRFIKGQHYISSEFINEDKNWNYKQWNKYHRRVATFKPSPKCSPSPTGRLEVDSGSESIEEKLEELNEEIDLQR